MEGGNKNKGDKLTRAEIRRSWFLSSGFLICRLGVARREEKVFGWNSRDWGGIGARANGYKSPALFTTVGKDPRTWFFVAEVSWRSQRWSRPTAEPLHRPRWPSSAAFPVWTICSSSGRRAAAACPPIKYKKNPSRNNNSPAQVQERRNDKIPRGGALILFQVERLNAFDFDTCHWSSCWLSSTFCWMASSSWLLIWRTSMRVRASSISAAFLRETAWSRTSQARRMISSLARWVSRTSRRAVSRSSRVASSSTSLSVSCFNSN